MSKLAIYAVVALVLTGALGGFVWHYRHLQSEAAKVPALEATIKASELRATDLSQQLAIANTRRDEADAGLTNWQEVKNDILGAVARLPRPAAATNAVCAPSDADRLVRNDAIGRLVGAGPDRGAGAVPAAAGTPDGTD